MDRERVAGWLAMELHIDVPGLHEAVRKAVDGCAYLEPLNLRRAASSIAYRVESALGYAGHPLHYVLNPEAFDDWHGIVARALAKAIRHEEDGPAGSHCGTPWG